MGKALGTRLKGFVTGILQGDVFVLSSGQNNIHHQRGAFICSIGVYTNANATVVLACVAGV